MSMESTGASWTESRAALLRVYLMAGDRSAGEPLHQAIVRAARQTGLRGATVLPGISGFGRSGHHGQLEVLVHDPLAQPMVVECADSEDALRAFLPVLERMDPYGRLATLERLNVLSCQAHDADAQGQGGA